MQSFEKDVSGIEDVSKFEKTRRSSVSLKG